MLMAVSSTRRSICYVFQIQWVISRIDWASVRAVRRMRHVHQYSRGKFNEVRCVEHLVGGSEDESWKFERARGWAMTFLLLLSFLDKPFILSPIAMSNMKSRQQAQHDESLSTYLMLARLFAAHTKPRWWVTCETFSAEPFSLGIARSFHVFVKTFFVYVARDHKHCSAVFPRVKIVFGCVQFNY